MVLIIVMQLLYGQKDCEDCHMRVSRWILGQLRKTGWAVPEWLDEKVLQRILLAFGCSIVLAAATGIYILFMGREEVTRIQRPVYGEGSFQESLEME